MKRLIGLSGYGGVGKDEVGRILVEQHGFTRFAKGDLIKEVALGINPKVDGPFRLFEVVQPLGWDKAKSVGDVRQFLQDLADEVVRVCGRDVWNDALYEKIEEHFRKAAFLRWEQPVVLTRLSLPGEAEQVKGRGGAMWRIERPGFGPANSHPNEVALDDWEFDAVIKNDSTRADLEEVVAQVVRDGGH